MWALRNASLMYAHETIYDTFGVQQLATPPPVYVMCLHSRYLNKNEMLWREGVACSCTGRTLLVGLSGIVSVTRIKVTADN